MTSALPMPLHLGGLHPFESLLLALLAFGPFVVLAAVVVVLRRRDLAEGEEGSPSGVADTEGRRPGG